MHSAGIPFVAASGVLTALVGRRRPRLGLLGLLCTVLLGLFFREPRRVPPDRPGVTSAADGKVSGIELAPAPAELGLGQEPMIRVSVFLSIFDVHVQRMPISATVEQIAYRPGKFVSADLDKASTHNERNAIALTSSDGHRVVVVQIAGLIARRIVCSARQGQRWEVGRTFGLIRFGSRVDVYLPSNSRILVRPGQRMIGGETVLAELPGAPR
jgi:phosphatidylserine decarboxylase